MVLMLPKFLVISDVPSAFDRHGARASPSLADSSEKLISENQVRPISREKTGRPAMEKGIADALDGITQGRLLVFERSKSLRADCSRKIFDLRLAFCGSC